MDNKYSNNAHDRELYGRTGDNHPVYKWWEVDKRIFHIQGGLQSAGDIAHHIEKNGCIGVQEV